MSKPITINDKEYTELKLRFDDLTGRDLIKANAEAATLGSNSPVNEFNKAYLAAVAAKAAKLKTDDILDLPALDFTNVTLVTQNFLFGMGSVTPQEPQKA